MDLALHLAACRAAHPITDWAIDMVLTYGPGVILCGALYGLRCTTIRALDRRATRRQLRAERQQMLRLAQAIKQAPLIPTQPGRDNTLLATCEAAWNADNTRKEKP